MPPWTKERRIVAFWDKVDIRGDDECWPWKAYLKPDGYGRVRWGDRNRQAQSVAYELTKGKIPRKHGVLHTCDNPPCCNPEHLYTGTQKRNMKDMYARGRGLKARGINHGMVRRRFARINKMREHPLPVGMTRLLNGAVPMRIIKRREVHLA